MSILGKTVRDKVTGFEGMATARTEHLYGDDLIFIEPVDLRGTDGKPTGGTWYEESRTEEIDASNCPVSEVVAGG